MRKPLVFVDSVHKIINAPAKDQSNDSAEVEKESPPARPAKTVRKPSTKE